MNTLEELFFSESRRRVDSALIKEIEETATSADLLNNCIYHMRLDTEIDAPSLDYSKRLRPYLCMLFGNENNHDKEVMCSLATSIELVHNATLIVDDIQDNDDYRCGRKALWQLKGIPEAMNCAFFLASIGQSLYHKTQVSNKLHDYSDYFHKQFGLLISGQQKDLSRTAKGSDSYFDMVDGKTGSLLQLCCVLGAYPHGGNSLMISELEKFALSFSRIHQLNDDIDDIEHGKKSSGGIRDYINVSEVQVLKNKIIIELEYQLDRLYDMGLIKTDKLRTIVSDLTNRHSQDHSSVKINVLRYA